jgi:LAS superfamily LD-carboxypeptidase LdcB
MTVKSVIEIDVLDDKFKAFQEAFNKYKKSVDEQSKKWKEVNKALEEAEKRQKAFNKAVQDGGQALRSAVGYSASVARNMADAAMSAAKWVAYASIGGGFGLGGLASSASNLRREATGLGVNTSQLRAARTYGEAYVPGIEGVMSGIQRLQTDVTQHYKLGILNGRLDKNAFQNLPDVLTKARETLQAYGGDLYTAKRITGGALSDVLSDEQLQTVGNMSPDEFARMISSLRTGAANFAVDEAKYEDFRKFWVSLKEAGNTIENSLIKNLVKLTEPLSRLSESVVKALDAFLGSQKAQDALKSFADYLGSDEFKQNVQTFFIALQRLGEATYNAAVFFGLIDKKQATPEDIDKARKQLPWWMPDYAAKGVAQSNRDLLSGVNPKLAKSIEMAGLDPISGYRTEAQQKVLYDAWVAGGKKGNLVAPPGQSRHQLGQSVDVTMASLNRFLSENSEKDLQEKYNLYRPHGSKDPNHLEIYNPNRTDIYVHFDGASRKAAPMAGKQ